MLKYSRERVGTFRRGSLTRDLRRGLDRKGASLLDCREEQLRRLNHCEEYAFSKILL